MQERDKTVAASNVKIYTKRHVFLNNLLHRPMYIENVFVYIVFENCLVEYGNCINFASTRLIGVGFVFRFKLKILGYGS